jgi:uncharacterized membrane protein YqhA
MPNNTPEKRVKLAQKIERFFTTKYLALLVSILLLLSGILTLIIGVKHIAEAILILANQQEGKAGVYIIESVDTFLFALVIFILAGGIFKLFVGNENTLKESMVFSRIQNFMDLKILLWETLLLTLTVWCSLGFFLQSEELSYDHLIFPVAIVLLALALKLMRGNNH